MQFEMLKEKSSIIKVIGVGGGGGNAVNHMYRQGITGVDFIICNTDAQALELSPIPNKVQLGASLTEGMGAGSIPEVGKNSAIENIDDIKEMLGSNTKMLFITAGMGGGTGTGASPIIAKAAKELDILTVGIVTTPFSFEGKRRKMQAEDGLEEMKKYVDSFLVISNDRLREIFGNLTLGSAFGQADDILTTAAKGIAEIITIPGYINVDFKDVRTVMKDSGVAIMGSYAAEGENRALKAVEGALNSPLLEDNEIEGARYILLNISSGAKEVTMDEVTVITDYIQQEAGLAADLIWGNCTDESLGDKLAVTIIATGFQTMEQRQQERGVNKIEHTRAPETPLVKPVELVNSFMPIEAETEETEEPELTTSVLDLFAGLSSVPAAEETSEMYSFTAETSEIPAFVENTSFSEPASYDESTVIEEPQLFQSYAEASEETSTSSAFEFELQVEEAEAELPFQSMVVEAEENQPEEQEEVSALPELELHEDAAKTDASVEEQLKISRDRIMRLKDLSMKLRSTNGLQELENEPAYKRKQLSLDDVPHSSESQVSRFTLSTEEGITEIRPNNSFLHDNVD